MIIYDTALKMYTLVMASIRSQLSKKMQSFKLMKTITSRQGPRLAEGLEAIAKAIYPEAFSE